MSKEDVNEVDFKTEDEAMDYVDSQMCKNCQKKAKRNKEIDYDGEHEDWNWTPCDKNWLIVYREVNKKLTKKK